MFARVLELTPKIEKKDEFVKAVKAQVVPILKKQHGFLEILPLFPEVKNEKTLMISLWAEKRDAEKYSREAYQKVEEILTPYLQAPIMVRHHMVETALCEHFVNALAA